MPLPLPALPAAAASSPDTGGMRSRYSSVAMALHWGIGLLLSAQFALGWWMTGIPKQPPGLRAWWFNLHKSTGITLALLILLRLAWRLAHAPPPLPALLPGWQRKAARWNHLALYACMLALPLSGYLGSSFTSYPVLFFGIKLPSWGHDWPAAKSAMSITHNLAAWTLSVLVCLHVLAACWHLLKRDGIFLRMWPGRRSAERRKNGTAC